MLHGLLKIGSPVDSSPTGQFEPFERGQYVLEPGRRITHSVLDGWLADPGVLDPWYTAQVYFYNPVSYTHLTLPTICSV